MGQSSTLQLPGAGVPRNRQGYSELQPPCLLPYGCHILRTPEPRTIHFDFLMFWLDLGRSDILLFYFTLGLRQRSWKSTAFRLRFSFSCSSLPPNARCLSYDLVKTPEHSLEKAEKKKKSHIVHYRKMTMTFFSSIILQDYTGFSCFQRFSVM